MRHFGVVNTLSLAAAYMAVLWGTYTVASQLI